MSISAAQNILDRKLVAVTGPDATAFLQGLVSNDINKATASQIAYAFILTPQGKYLFDFFIVRVAEGYWLDAAATDAAALAAKLTQYKLRAKVSVAVWNDAVVASDIQGAPFSTPQAQGFTDSRFAAMGTRVYLPHDAYGPPPAAPPSAYLARRIALGVPEGPADYQRDGSFLLDCNAEELHAVDFRKGCYVGQELTARMKHRGTARRRILRVAGEGLASGAAILDGTREIGTVLSVSGPYGLATTRLDRWREAQGRPLTADGRPVELSLPAYPMILPPEEAAP
jgi:tRNA-modifying protein YgfZ